MLLLVDNLTSLHQIDYFVQVNNAAIAISKDTTDTTAEDIYNILSINLEAPYHLCQLAQPLLKASGAGNIVFISSVAGLVALPSISIYASSKGVCEGVFITLTMDLSRPNSVLICIKNTGAINQLTKNLACEWAKDSIRVNCVAPWVIRTEMLQRLEVKILVFTFLVVNFYLI